MYSEKFKELFDKIMENNQDDPENGEFIINFVYERTGKFVNYFNKVYEDTAGTTRDRTLFAAGRLSQEDLQYNIERRDSARRSAHEMAIAACQQINRQCQANGIPNICPDTSDRYEIANFIGDFIQDVYQEGIGKGKEQEKETKGNSLDDAFAFAKEKYASYKASAESVKTKMEEKWKTTEQSR